MSSHMIVFIILVVVGIAAMVIGRFLPTSDDEKWKEDSRAVKFILGPPGFFRSTAIRGGFLLIVLGLVGSAWKLFF